MKGRRVVEAGAYDYNGTVRRVYEAMGPASYLATDAQPGPGVDLVCPAEKLPDLLGDGSRRRGDLDGDAGARGGWRAAVTGMVRVLAPGGLLLLTTRSPGFPYHPHPGDHWRFTVDDMDGIAEACGLEVVRLEPTRTPRRRGCSCWPASRNGVGRGGMAEGLAVIEPGPPR